jgi:acetyl-CoA carboxylase beta subunit
MPQVQSSNTAQPTQRVSKWTNCGSWKNLLYERTVKKLTKLLDILNTVVHLHPKHLHEKHQETQNCKEITARKSTNILKFNTTQQKQHNNTGK